MRKLLRGVKGCKEHNKTGHWKLYMKIMMSKIVCGDREGLIFLIQSSLAIRRNTLMCSGSCVTCIHVGGVIFVSFETAPGERWKIGVGCQQMFDNFEAILTT